MGINTTGELLTGFIKEGKFLVSQVYAQPDLKATIREAVKKIGGFEKLNLTNKKVLLKPNFNTADPFPASSDPRFVVALIELLYEFGAAKVILGEASTYYLNTRQVLNKTGLVSLAEKAGAEIHIFTENPYLVKKIPGQMLKKASLPKILDEIDRLIYVCCLKTHFKGDFTMSLKNAMGLVKPAERIFFHLRGLREKIADLNTVVHPDLILIDGRKCFINGGPAKGEEREPNIVMASGDRIAIDVEGIKIIQSFPGNNLAKDPWDYLQIKKAVALGLGSQNDNDYLVV